MNKQRHPQEKGGPNGLNCRIGNSFTLALAYPKDNLLKAVALSTPKGAGFIPSKTHCRIRPVKHTLATLRSLIK